MLSTAEPKGTIRKAFTCMFCVRAPALVCQRRDLGKRI